jgi:hypothetical protein
MKIVNHRPASRGVTQLMYVGDDEAVDGATSSMSKGLLAVLAVIAGAILLTRK